jgi:hypothetical protein
VNPVPLGLIVTGHGEQESVPILIRRIASDVEAGLQVCIRDVLRVPESSLRKPGQLERHVERLSRLVPRPAGILIVLDCDWAGGCPATEGPGLLARARQTRPNRLISVVLAKQEFETWILAAAESVRDERGLPSDLDAPADPESIRGAKEWLRHHMPANRAYSSTTDQPALAALLDIQMARLADSFDKFYREVTTLLRGLMLITE